ncbi:MAG: hypothetical protein M1812_002274 [Candelaria pacifica]|nr:MAG: hypothetical protein M1812_002274 [Candelaria pacifica]
MSLSDSSSLSSAPPTDDESKFSGSNPKGGGKLGNGSNAGTAAGTSPTQRKRPASPPHEYVLADNDDIAFIVMFRSRFNDAFPKSLSHYGPQDIEKGVAETLPGEHVENLLCMLLGLVLNRKKYVERGHHQRALEEAIQTHNSQWPPVWNRKNPLSGGRTFATMSPLERLTLLKTLIMWALSSSEAIQAILKESYKQARHDDDLNQPLSVQPWGRDGDKRRYWLIEGQDDTYFRLYRESNPTLKHNTWWSVAGTIDELKGVAERLQEDGTQAARRLSERISLSIPRFEATDEKRKRREYRQARKTQFVRAEPGFSLYEGRTRGKRMKYTYSDEEEDGSDANSTKRSNRQSGLSTPAEPAGPTFTASGRQVRSRHGGAYGEKLHSGQETDRSTPAAGGTEGQEDASEVASGVNGRPRRSGLRQDTNGWAKGTDHIAGYNSVDEMEDEDDAASSGGDWDAGEDEADDQADDQADDDIDEQDENVSDEDSEIDGEEDSVGKFRSLVVQLRYNQKPGTGANIPNGNSGTRQVQSRSSKAMPIPPPDTLTNGHATAAPPENMATKKVMVQSSTTNLTPCSSKNETYMPHIPHQAENPQDVQMGTAPPPTPPPTTSSM